MTSITHEEFEAQVQQQKKEPIKWRKLQDGMIYTFVSIEFFNTKYGDEAMKFAPSALMNILKRENKPFPRFVRPKGLEQCKKNPEHKCFGFDLV